MISADEIRAARERAGLTQQKLGELVGVGLRTVGNWERGETVPRNREAVLRRVLADHLDDTGPAPLRTVADAEVVAEVARRISIARERERREHDAAAITHARGSRAELDALRDEVLAAFERYRYAADKAWQGKGADDVKVARLTDTRAAFVAQITAAFAREGDVSSEDVG